MNTNSSIFNADHCTFQVVSPFGASDHHSNACGINTEVPTQSLNQMHIDASETTSTAMGSVRNPPCLISFGATNFPASAETLTAAGRSNSIATVDDMFQSHLNSTTCLEPYNGNGNNSNTTALPYQSWYGHAASPVMPSPLQYLPRQQTNCNEQSEANNYQAASQVSSMVSPMQTQTMSMSCASPFIYRQNDCSPLHSNTSQFSQQQLSCTCAPMSSLPAMPVLPALPALPELPALPAMQPVVTAAAAYTQHHPPPPAYDSYNHNNHNEPTCNVYLQNDGNCGHGHTTAHAFVKDTNSAFPCYQQKYVLNGTMPNSSRSEVCDHVRSALYRHMRNQPLKRESVMSAVCDVSSPHNAPTSIHVRSNNFQTLIKQLHRSGDHTYTCLECKNAFFQRSQLLRHLRDRHLIKATHACPFCEKTFHQKSNLDAHCMTHASERKFSHPFKCVVCEQDGKDKRFTRKSSLKRHCQTKHKNVDVESEWINSQQTPKWDSSTQTFSFSDPKAVKFRISDLSFRARQVLTQHAV